jgi:hypothetical protein
MRIWMWRRRAVEHRSRQAQVARFLEHRIFLGFRTVVRVSGTAATRG